MIEVMQRVEFRLKLRPERIDGYVDRHGEAVWPDMLQFLRDTGWHHYLPFHNGTMAISSAMSRHRILNGLGLER
jgi:L-rhamnose mutarotase